MKKLNGVVFLGLGIAFFATLAAFFGIWTLDIVHTVEYATIRSEVVQFVMHGLYRYNPVWFVVEGVAWDYVTLFFALPLLLYSLFMFMRKSMQGFLGLLGAAVYFFYQYILWATTLAYNSFFLVYVFICSMSFVLCALLLEKIGPLDFKRSVATCFPRRSLSIFLGLLGAFFAFLWLSIIVPTIYSGDVPLVFVGVPTLIVQAYDLALLIPFVLLASIALWRDFGWAYLVSSVFVIKFTFLSIAIIAMVLVKYWILSTPIGFDMIPFLLLVCSNLFFLGKIWKCCDRSY